MGDNLATASEGAQVVMATCCDYRYPPDNAIDGDEGTFWATTGGFPQELVVDLGAGVQMTGLDFVSMNVKKLSLETSEGGASDRFDAVIKQMEMPNLQDKLQSQRNLKVNKKVRTLKFIIHDGWQEFASVHLIGVKGTRAD